MVSNPRSSCSVRPAISRPACCFRRCSSLEHRERLENLRIIGYARQEWTDRPVPREPARRDRHDGTDIDEKYLDKFIDRIEFHGGDISVESLRTLHDVLDGPAIFYLALPPGVFADAAETIAKAGLADETNGWRRLVIEKPFGTDLATALALERAAAPRTGAKTRSSASTTSSARRPCRTCSCSGSRTGSSSPCCKSAHVDEIQITVAETLGVEGRSRYYDGIGALRDMIQNHLIQMMTFATMEPPALWDAEMIRDHKVEVLKAVRRVDPELDAVRGQYTAGLVEGAAGDRLPRRAGCRSRRRRTDTFAALRLHLDTWRWEGMPVLLRSGKRLAAKAHEVVYRFSEPPTRLFRHTPLERTRAELARVPDEPDGVHRARDAHEAAGARSRGPRVGPARRVRRQPTTGRHRRTSSCLLDVLEGDHTPFLRFDEVEWSWRIVDPVLKGGRRVRPRTTSPAATVPRASTVSSIRAMPGGH